MRFKSFIAIIIISVLSLAAEYELCVGIFNVTRNQPTKISDIELTIDKQESKLLSRERITITHAHLNRQPVVIFGDPKQTGWLFPKATKSPHVDYSKVDAVFKYHSFHPYIRYSVGSLLCAIITIFGTRVLVGLIKDLKHP